MKKVKKLVRKTVVKRKPATNKLFPGKANYVGPQRGYFAFVHHGKLFEEADQEISDRVDYIKSHKPNSEINTRLRHLIYLGEKLNKRIKDYDNKNGGRQALYDREIQAAVLAYAKRHIDPLRWRGGTLRHHNGEPFCG